MKKGILLVIVLGALALLTSVGNMLYRGDGDMSTCVNDGSIIDTHKGPDGKTLATLLVVRDPSQPAPPDYDVKCARRDGRVAYYQFDVPVNAAVVPIVSLVILMIIGLFAFGRRSLPSPC